MSFEQPITEKLESKKELEVSVPEILVQREKSLELLAGIKDRYKIIGDEEAVEMFALTHGHPEWTKEILLQVKKYKPHVKNPEELQRKIVRDLSLVTADEVGESKTNDESKWWEKNKVEVQTRIEKLIKYFKPKPETSKIEKVIIIPSDRFLTGKNSGRSFHISNKSLIMSHTENFDNLGHEFLHGVINPIVEKLMFSLSEDEKEKIVNLAGNKLKQDYGEDAFSLLCEEFIRTYNNYIRKRERPRTLDEFRILFENMDEDQFNQIVEKEGSSAKDRFEKMGIKTLQDLVIKVKDYYEQYEKDELRERIFRFYQFYEKEGKNREDLSFEQFVLEKFRTDL